MKLTENLSWQSFWFRVIGVKSYGVLAVVSGRAEMRSVKFPIFRYERCCRSILGLWDLAPDRGF